MNVESTSSKSRIMKTSRRKAVRVETYIGDSHQVLIMQISIMILMTLNQGMFVMLVKGFKIIKFRITEKQGNLQKRSLDAGKDK